MKIVAKREAFSASFMGGKLELVETTVSYYFKEICR